MTPVARHLPTGTVTFLFTDVEGSTKLLRERGAMRRSAHAAAASYASASREASAARVVDRRAAVPARVARIPTGHRG